MSWAEVSQGVFERPLGDQERYVKTYCDTALSLGREHWAVGSSVTFVFKERLSSDEHRLEGLLREAWRRLRLQHPSIAAQLVNGKVRYEVPDAAALESWVKETLVVTSPATNVSDVIGQRRLSDLSILYYLPATSQIVLQSSHWRLDGIGSLFVLDAFCDLVCSTAAGMPPTLPWGSETVRLAPSFEVMADSTREPTAELMDIAVRAAGGEGLLGTPIGIESKGDVNTLPGQTRTERVQIDTSQSAAVIAACKSRGITVTSAIHASVAKAVYAFAKEADRSKHYLGLLLFSTRPLLPAPYNTDLPGHSLSLSPCLCAVRPDGSWAEYATRYNSKYRTAYSQILPAHVQYVGVLMNILESMPPPAGVGPSEINLSSMGIVDRFIKPIHKEGDTELEVTDITTEAEVVSRQPLCHVWTFRDKLNIQLEYNDAYYNSERVQKILDYIITTTVEELGVS